MKKYKLEDFMPKVINTRTKEEYDLLMKKLESLGYKWNCRKKPTKVDIWWKEKENTCVEINICSAYSVYKKIMYCSYNYFKKNDYEIIPFNKIEL